MSILHFEVDDILKPHLIGPTVAFHLNEETIPDVPNPQDLTAITISSRSHLTSALLDQLPKVKLVITRSVGTDHIDTQLLNSRGIALKNIPDYGSYNIAEHTMALLLAGARNIVAADKDVKAGRFSYREFMGMALKDKVLGVIGTGKIGMEFIKRAKAFEFTILAFDALPNQPAAESLGFTYVPLEQLLKESDFVSIHIPLLPQTKHLLSSAEFNLMKDGSVLVNTSRGAIIDTQALVKHVSKFKAVCLDVLEDEENFSKENPLLACPNIIATPHIAFFTDDSIKRIADETNRMVKEFLATSGNQLDQSDLTAMVINH